MKVSRYLLAGAGLAVGFVLGSRAGRGRYEQLSSWARKTSDDLGVGPAVDRVVESARETAMDLRETASERAHDALQAGAEAVGDSVKSAGNAVTPDA